MSIAIFRAAILSFSLLATSCHAPRETTDTRAPQMSDVLQARRVNDWEMNTAGLSQLPSGQKLEHADEMEIFTLPTRPNTADMFVYRIILDHKTGHYWIERSGGFAGGTTIFGPGEIGRK